VIDWLKEIVRKPSPLMLAARELDDARRELLLAQTHRDYADSSVKYNEARIRRLEHIINEMSDVQRVG
jgi:hypothetical protein